AAFPAFAEHVPAGRVGAEHHLQVVAQPAAVDLRARATAPVVVDLAGVVGGHRCRPQGVDAAVVLRRAQGAAEVVAQVPVGQAGEVPVNAGGDLRTGGALPGQA